jgi:predicted alpha/beta superfamily hydrolase
MKRPVFFLFGVLVIAVTTTRLTAESDGRPAFPAYVLAGSQLRVLPKSANGHDYKLFIATPASYGTDPQKHYPVLYACDGNWSFVLLCGIYGGLAWDGVVPEYILVGIGYTADDAEISRLRLVDYLPPRDLGREADPERRGRADEFLAVLEKEIIPFVEREYRVDPQYRVLAGGSAGGLFALYTLFTHPELFQGYVAVSPGTGADSGLAQVEELFAKTGHALSARLFMSGATEDRGDFLRDIQKYDAHLRQRNYPGLVYEWRLVQGQGHGGTGPESFARGIRFAFAPIAPKSHAN